MCWRISSRSNKFITLGHALSCCLPIFVGWYYMYTCVRVSEQLNDELKQNLKKTMTEKYNQTNYEHITKAVDKLQQEVSVCNGWRSPDTNVVQLWEISLHIWISTLASMDAICVHPLFHIANEPGLPSQSHMDSHVVCWLDSPHGTLSSHQIRDFGDGSESK